MRFWGAQRYERYRTIADAYEQWKMQTGTGFGQGMSYVVRNHILDPHTHLPKCLARKPFSHFCVHTERMSLLGASYAVQRLSPEELSYGQCSHTSGEISCRRVVVHLNVKCADLCLRRIPL